MCCLRFSPFYRLAGMEYSYVVTIYGISRAGFIPQLFSLRLPNPTVIYELLLRAQAKALIYDPSFNTTVSDSPVPFYCAGPRWRQGNAAIRLGRAREGHGRGGSRGQNGYTRERERKAEASNGRAILEAIRPEKECGSRNCDQIYRWINGGGWMIIALVLRK